MTCLWSLISVHELSATARSSRILPTMFSPTPPTLQIPYSLLQSVQYTQGIRPPRPPPMPCAVQYHRVVKWLFTDGSVYHLVLPPAFLPLSGFPPSFFNNHSLSPRRLSRLPVLFSFNSPFLLVKLRDQRQVVCGAVPTVVFFAGSRVCATLVVKFRRYFAIFQLFFSGQFAILFRFCAVCGVGNCAGSHLV